MPLAVWLALLVSGHFVQWLRASVFDSSLRRHNKSVVIRTKYIA